MNRTYYSRHNEYTPLPAWQRYAICLFVWLCLLALLYVVVSLAAFQLRNPKANDMTTLCSPRAVLCWRVLPRFQ